MPDTKIKLPLSAEKTLKTPRELQNLIFCIRLKANSVLLARKPDLCVLLFAEDTGKIHAARKLDLQYARSKNIIFLPD